MPNDFSKNPWIIDSLTAGPPAEDAKAGEPKAPPQKPESPDMVRIRRVTYVGKELDQVEIVDNSGRVVWEIKLPTGTTMVTDDLNLPGGRLNWDGFRVTKMGSTGKIYLSYV